MLAKEQRLIVSSIAQAAIILIRLALPFEVLDLLLSTLLEFLLSLDLLLSLLLCLLHEVVVRLGWLSALGQPLLVEAIMLVWLGR